MAILTIPLFIAGFVFSYWLMTHVSPESGYALASVNLLGVCMIIPGGRVLVLPVIFLLLLVLTYWAAKPRSEE